MWGWVVAALGFKKAARKGHSWVLLRCTVTGAVQCDRVDAAMPLPLSTDVGSGWEWPPPVLLAEAGGFVRSWWVH